MFKKLNDDDMFNLDKTTNIIRLYKEIIALFDNC